MTYNILIVTNVTLKCFFYDFYHVKKRLFKIILYSKIYIKI